MPRWLVNWFLLGSALGSVAAASPLVPSQEPGAAGRPAQLAPEPCLDAECEPAPGPLLPQPAPAAPVPPAPLPAVVSGATAVSPAGVKPLMTAPPAAPPRAKPTLAPAVFAAPGAPAVLPLPAMALGPAPARRTATSWGGFAGGRRLHGHSFIPSQYLRDPFTATYFTATTRATLAQSALPSATAPAEPLVFAGYAQEFSLQVSIFQALAVRGTLRAGVRSGLTAAALRLQGTDAYYGGSAGVTASLRLKSALRLGVAGDVDYAPNYNVNILRSLDSVLNPAPDSLGVLLDRVASQKDSLLTQREPLWLSLAVSLAAGLHRAVGLLAEVTYRNQIRSVAPGASADAFSAAAALSLDLRGVSKVPLGAVLGYRLGTALGGLAGLPLQQGMLGIFYTGRPQLALGLDCQLSGPLSGAAALAFEGAVVMRSYF